MRFALPKLTKTRLEILTLFWTRMYVSPPLLCCALLAVFVPICSSQVTVSWLHGVVSGFAGNNKPIVDRLFGLYDSYTAEEKTGFLRIEGHFVKLVNENGILADGSSCDPIGECDPVISAYVDYENSAADFGAPASADFQFYTPVLTVKEQKSPLIDKSIVRDICGQSFKKIAVRVHAIDFDRVGPNDLIGNFRCVVDVHKAPARNVELAEWSDVHACDGMAQQQKIQILWKYRWYQVAAGECGTLPTSQFTTVASQ